MVKIETIKVKGTYRQTQMSGIVEMLQNMLDQSVVEAVITLRVMAHVHGNKHHCGVRIVKLCPPSIELKVQPSDDPSSAAQCFIAVKDGDTNLLHQTLVAKWGTKVFNPLKTKPESKAVTPEANPKTSAPLSEESSEALVTAPSVGSVDDDGTFAGLPYNRGNLTTVLSLFAEAGDNTSITEVLSACKPSANPFSVGQARRSLVSFGWLIPPDKDKGEKRFVLTDKSRQLLRDPDSVEIPKVGARRPKKVLIPAVPLQESDTDKVNSGTKADEAKGPPSVERVVIKPLRLEEAIEAVMGGSKLLEELRGLRGAGDVLASEYKALGEQIRDLETKREEARKKLHASDERSAEILLQLGGEEKVAALEKMLKQLGLT